MKTLLALGSILLAASTTLAQERKPQEQKPTPSPTPAASRKSFFESRSNTAKGVPGTPTPTPTPAGAAK